MGNVQVAASPRISAPCLWHFSLQWTGETAVEKLYRPRRGDASSGGAHRTRVEDELSSACIGAERRVRGLGVGATWVAWLMIAIRLHIFSLLESILYTPEYGSSPSPLPSKRSVLRHVRPQACPRGRTPTSTYQGNDSKMTSLLR
jgi:hypothetical protein